MFWEVFNPPVNWHSNGLCRCVSCWKRGGFYCYVGLPSCKPQQILILQVATGIEIGIQRTKTVKPVPLWRRSLPDLSNILHLGLDGPWRYAENHHSWSFSRRSMYDVPCIECLGLGYFKLAGTFWAVFDVLGWRKADISPQSAGTLQQVVVLPLLHTIPSLICAIPRCSPSSMEFTAP